MRNSKIAIHSAATLLFLVLCIVAGSISLASEQIVLRVHSPLNPINPAEQLFNEYLREYERLNPHVKIENMGRNHDVDKLITSYAGGEMADIISHSTGTLFSLYNMGMLAPAPDDLQQRIRSELFPTLVEELTIDGRVIGIPNENNVLGLLYNSRVLQESGLSGDAPVTYDEMELFGKAATRYDADGNIVTPGIAIGGDAWKISHFFEAVFSAEGGQFVDANGQLAMDSPALYKSLDRILRWAGYAGATPILQLAEGPWHDGKAAMGIGWQSTVTWTKSVYPGDFDQDVHVGLLPSGSAGPASVFYGHGFAVNASSPHADEAWKFLEWLAFSKNPDGSTPLGHIMAVFGTLPVNIADLQTDAFLENRSIVEGFIANLAYAHGYHTRLRYGLRTATSLHMFGDLIVNVLNGRVDLTQGIQDQLHGIQTYMAEWNAGQ